MDIEKTVNDLKNRQTLVIPWLLAVGVGIIGNLTVNLMFQGLDFSYLKTMQIPLTICIIAIIGISTLVFLYLRTNVQHQTIVMLRWNGGPETKMYPPDPLKQEEIRKRLGMENKPNLCSRLNDYANLMLLGLLRDYLKNHETKILKIKIEKLSELHAIYSVTAEFKRQSHFWYWNTPSKLGKDLSEINDAILNAKIAASGFSLNDNEKDWKDRGQAFFAEIEQWDLQSMTSKIEEQITKK